MMKHAALNLF